MHTGPTAICPNEPRQAAVHPLAILTTLLLPLFVLAKGLQMGSCTCCCQLYHFGHILCRQSAVHAVTSLAMLAGFIMLAPLMQVGSSAGDHSGPKPGPHTGAWSSL